MLEAQPAAPHDRSARLPADVYIVVPAYNEAEQIGRVVQELLQVARTIVVVDDASTDETAAIARSARASVLRHVLNRGQGAALQTGIDWSLRSGARWIVTFDSDGQHRADDLPRLLGPLINGECDVTLGSRFLAGASGVPPARRILLRLATLFTRAVSGMNITDTHNGLRAFSRRAASTIHLRLDRMAHASELLDQIRVNGLSYREVAVHIRYTDYSRSKGQRSVAALRIVFDYLMNRWTR